jgi:hypothetical protein
MTLTQLALDAQTAVERLRDFDALLKALVGGASLLDPSALDPVQQAFAVRLQAAETAVDALRAAIGPDLRKQ